jgi:hypothetical protein
MQPTITVSQSDVARINEIIHKIAKSARRVKGITTQAMVFALQSAAKATKPGSGTSLKNLPRKFRLRPIETMPTTYFWYRWITGTGNTGIFRSDSQIRDRKDITRIKRGIKFWNRKIQGWDYIPYEGGAGKYNDSQPRARIPFAGWAKLGWLWNLSLLGGKQPDVSPRAPVSEFSRRETANEINLRVVNRVDYAYKTSPQSAAIGLEKARNRIEKIYLPKLAQEIKDAAR